MCRYPGCVRIVSDHKLVPRSGLYCESSFTARERIYSPAPADESARANGKTVQLPACRSLLPSTVNVQRESTISSIKRTGVGRTCQASTSKTFSKFDTCLSLFCFFRICGFAKTSAVPSQNDLEVPTSAVAQLLSRLFFSFWNYPPPQSADEGAGGGAKWQKQRT